jgi:hypothetical protein
MMTNRRNVLVSTLFGAGYVGLRALATGLPAALFASSRTARANAATCVDKSKAQYLILHTSGSGDPWNANVPGTYDDARIMHPAPADGSMAPTALTMGGVKSTAALPWAQLPQSVLDRTTFWHIMTNTPVHPNEQKVLRLMDATTPNEMLPSLLAKQLAPCLGSVQSQPITLGAASPSEGLSYNGAALPIIPPLALKTTLTSPTGPLTNLQALRDQTLANIGGIYRNANASPAQKRYLDSLVQSQSEIRNIRQDLLGLLGSIKDNSVTSQISAALALVQMNVTPVIAIHIPMGGDNHFDTALAGEAKQQVAGVQAIGSLMQQLDGMGYGDQVTFMSLDVFGRTLMNPSSPGNGRQHNPNHQVSVTIGKQFKAGIIGGVAPINPADLTKDYGALPINSSTGAGGAGGDISAADTLASFGKTALAGMGVSSSTIDSLISAGKVITGALA